MSMENRTGFIWFDGQWVSWPDAKVHVLSHTLHYGLGVFEGVRAYQTPQGTAIFRLKEHTDRLYRSAHILQMRIPFEKEELLNAQQQILRSNELTSAYIRPLCFYGADALGIHIKPTHTVHVVIAAWPWGAYLGEDALQKGIRVKTSSFTRHHVNITMCKAKANGNYMNSILAHQEAIDCGYEEALLLDNEGYVAEGSGENVFIIRNGELYTPELASCLDGITRATVMQLAHDHGYIVKERRLTRDEVYVADEAFFTGTAAEITPIREVDGRIIGTGQRGPITERIQQLYFDTVKGVSKDTHHWLTYI